jgi:hypothetical protein
MRQGLLVIKHRAEIAHVEIITAQSAFEKVLSFIDVLSIHGLRERIAYRSRQNGLDVTTGATSNCFCGLGSSMQSRASIDLV